VRAMLTQCSGSDLRLATARATLKLGYGFVVGAGSGMR
jgi:hypothetical protein